MILHCGAAKTEREKLARVCTPDGENTWLVPSPHLTLRPAFNRIENPKHSSKSPWRKTNFIASHGNAEECK